MSVEWDTSSIISGGFVGEKLEPEIEEQHMALIRLIDQVRMLDQDLIRLQQKADVVLEYRENEKKKRIEEKMKLILPNMFHNYAFIFSTICNRDSP